MSTTVFFVIALAETILVGGMFLLYPRFARRGLLFGVYVGEQAWDGEEARAITRGWYRAMIVWLAACLGLGTALTALVPKPPLVGLFPLVLVAGFAILYVRAYVQARRFAIATPAPAVAFLGAVPESSLALPLVALGAGLLAGIVSIIYAAAWYPALPARVPTHFGGGGAPDVWHAKSFASVMLAPILTLVMGIGLGGASVLTARAKRAVRYPDTEISLDAQLRFRRAVTRMISTVTLLMSVSLLWMNIAMIRTAAGLAAGIPWPVMASFIAMAVVALVGSLYIGLRYGQGGSRVERQARAPLTDGLADNRRWVLGAFYVNRDDPSLVVEDRFGLGYTLNFGNWKAVAFVGGFLVLTLGLVIAAAILL